MCHGRGKFCLDICNAMLCTLLNTLLNQQLSFRLSSNISSLSRDTDQLEIMRRTLNITGYSVHQLANDKIFHVAFPFQKEANWYNDKFSDNSEMDLYAKMYNFLGERELNKFWKDLYNCSLKVCPMWNIKDVF